MGINAHKGNYRAELPTNRESEKAVL
jgi:hypothetical protein